MAVTFRPYWGFTAACGAALAVLLGLGLWQLERLEWKRDLARTVEQRIAAEPEPLDRVLARYRGDEALAYRHVRVSGEFDHAHEFHRFVATEGGGGYHIYTPLIRSGAAPVLVNRGLVPAAQKDPGARAAGQTEGSVEITGLVRLPRGRPPFAPDNDGPRNQWFWLDLKRMAETATLEDLLPVTIDADDTGAPGPKGGQTRVTFRNDHLGYALTWFGLATGLAAVYLAYHIKAGRLRFNAD